MMVVLIIFYYSLCKGDIILGKIKTKYLKRLVVAASLVVPFNVLASPIVKAETPIQVNTNQKVSEGTYDVILKTYRDQTNDSSITSNYLKEPKVTIKDGKKIVTVTVQDSDYFQYLRVEDYRTPGVFHDVQVISEDKRKNGTKVVQFEIGEFSKKYNMQMHVLIPTMGYDHKYQVQFEIDASNMKEDSSNKPVDSKELIPDEKLRQHINQWVLNREDANAPITKEDLLEIKDIYLDNKEIKDYRGLEYLQNLESLSLRNAQIKDLSVISKLKNLKVIDLSYSQMNDIKPLTELKKVEELYLRETKLSDYSPLNEMKSITRLDLIGNNIEDIRPICTLTSLKSLFLSSNNISNITGINQLTNLEELSLGYNTIHSIQPISELKNLKELDLKYNEINDISPLSKLEQLNTLNLETNYINDISTLSMLPNLSNVNLDANAISDIRPLKNIKRANIQRQKIFLNEGNINEAQKVQIFDPSGNLPASIKLKEQDGTVTNGVIKWKTAGEKEFTFETSFDAGGYYPILFNGTVMQNVVVKKETPATSFSDVPNWAKESVDYLVNKHIINGYPDGRFAPYDQLTRAQAAKIIAKTVDLPVDSSAKPTFYDSQDHWASPYIAAVEEKGIIIGDGTGKYNPEAAITRAEMATILVRTYNLNTKVNSNNSKLIFSDLKGHWGEDYVNILINKGISIGTGSGWEPDRFVTRAEAAQFVAKTDKMK